PTDDPSSVSINDRTHDLRKDHATELPRDVGRPFTISNGENSFSIELLRANGHFFEVLKVLEPCRNMRSTPDAVAMPKDQIEGDVPVEKSLLMVQYKSRYV